MRTSDQVKDLYGTVYKTEERSVTRRGKGDKEVIMTKNCRSRLTT